MKTLVLVSCLLMTLSVAFAQGTATTGSETETTQDGTTTGTTTGTTEDGTKKP